MTGNKRAKHGDWYEGELHTRAQARGGEAGADGECMTSGGSGTGRDRARYPGKRDGVVREEVELKYAWIERNRARWPVSLSCKMLGVTKIGYRKYRRLSTAPPRPGKRIGNEALLVPTVTGHLKPLQRISQRNGSSRL